MSILVSDFDRTYDRTIKDIELNNEAIIKFILAGNYFVLSSSRPLNSLLRKVNEHDIPFTHLGSCDGNFLFNSRLDRIFTRTIPHSVVEQTKHIRSLPEVERIQFTYPGSYSDTFYDDEDLADIAFVVKDEKITREFLESYDSLRHAHPEYQYRRDGNRGTGYYKIRPLGLSKSTPIKFLAQELQIPYTEVYSIGDGDNDFELIRDFNGFMVGENKELKKVALGKYNAVHELVEDIAHGKALKR